MWLPQRQHFDMNAINRPMMDSNNFIYSQNVMKASEPQITQTEKSETRVKPAPGTKNLKFDASKYEEYKMTKRITRKNSKPQR